LVGAIDAAIFSLVATIAESAMNRLNQVVLAAALLASTFMARPAAAQRFFGSRTNSLTSLAANEAVQKDIGVSGQTVERLSALNDAYRNASQKEFTALGIDYSAISDLPALERAAEMRRINEATSQVNRKLTAEYLPKLAEVLSPEQIQRLKQIQLQASGIDAWIEAETAKDLEFTEDQIKKLTELRNDYSRRQQLLDGDFQQRFTKIRELNAERDAKAIELLSTDQRARLAALQGVPFDVSQLGFRRRGNN
jgi:hypothetical protein